MGRRVVCQTHFDTIIEDVEEILCLYFMGNKGPLYTSLYKSKLERGIWHYIGLVI